MSGNNQSFLNFPSSAGGPSGSSSHPVLASTPIIVDELPVENPVELQAENLIQQLDSLSRVTHSSLLQNLELPSFKKGVLSPETSTTLVRKYSNRAAVLLDKLYAANKV